MSDKNPHIILECCADSVESAVAAEEGGADRLELCSNLVIGGTTPTPALYQQVRRHTKIPIHVLIRPRYGDFLYTEQEFSVILKEAEQFREAGANGIVIGCLTPDGSLDVKRLRLLKEHAGRMHVTLHRAFDMCRDPRQALEEAVSLGIRTILTSGCSASCGEGIPLLKLLHRQADGRLEIMAGGGVNAASVPTLLSRIPLTALHMSGKKITESQMQYRNPNVSMGLPGMDEYGIWRADKEEIAAVRALLDEFEK